MQIISVRRKIKPWIWILALLISLVIACFAVVLFAAKTSAPIPVDSVFEQKVTPKSFSSNILFTGNTYWGRYINDWSMASPLKYAYPFSRLNEFNRESYDAWISGLECPMVAGVNLTSAEEDSTLAFNCSPNYLPEAAKWFTAFTLANNHTDNQGIEGFAETKQHLEENDIQYFGHYDPDSLEDICEVFSMPVTITNSDETTKKGLLPMAFCGYHAIFKLPSDEAVAEIEKYSQIMPVVAMPHMGAEYESAPDQLKINFFRSLIDAGADMVIGDHPHTIQSTESYKGKLIVYSMGNFIFDQQFNTEVTRSAAIKLVMNDTSDNSNLISKWLALGEKCSTFKDECLDQAKQLNLKKLNITYQFSVIGTNDANKIVKPATADQQQSILNRLQWQTTIKNLQSPYSGL